MPSDHQIKVCSVKIGLSPFVLTARLKAPSRDATGDKDVGLAAISVTPVQSLAPAKKRCWRGAFQPLRQRQTLGKRGSGTGSLPPPMSKAPAGSLWKTC